MPLITTTGGNSDALQFEAARRRACRSGSFIGRICQGCGLGLDVSVSRRSRDVPTSRLGLVSAIYVSCPRPIFGQIVQATVRSVNGF